MKQILLLACGVAISFSIGCSTSKKKQEKTDQLAKTESQMTKKTEHKKIQAYNCVVKKDTRIIELDKKPKRCEVHYTKFGDKSQVAWAEATPSICSDVYSKIRKNIEDKGFKCVDLTAKIDRSAASSQ